MFDYDDVTQEDKNFICDLVDKTTFNNNEQIYVETKDPKMAFFDRGSETDKTMGKWLLREKKMKMLAKKIKLQNK